MLRAFHFNLTALSWVALLVGLFLVYNTVAVSVIARREEIGTLRALGDVAADRARAVPRRGRGARRASARRSAPARGGCWRTAAVRLTSTTVNTLYVATAATVPPLSPGQALVAVLAGLALSMAAAAAPALEASRVTPLAALRGTDRLEARYRVRIAPPRRRRRAAGARGRALAARARRWPARSSGSGPRSRSCSAWRSSCRRRCTCSRGLAAGSLGRLFGIEGALAHANLSGAIPRLAVSVAALAVALSMMVAIAVMIGSFRETVVYWVGQTLQADLYIATARRSSLDTQATISPELEAAVASHPAVDAVDRFRSVEPRVRRPAHRARLRRLPGAARARQPAVQGAARRQGGGCRRDRPRRGRRLGGVRAEGRHRRGRPPHAQDPARRGARSEVAAVYYDYTTDRGVSRWTARRSRATTAICGRPA